MKTWIVVLLVVVFAAPRTLAAEVGIREAIQREAGRADTGSGTIYSRAGDDFWDQLARLAPGTPMFLTRRGHAMSRPLVLQIDEAGLFVLEITDPAMEGAAEVLKRLAKEMPRALISPSKGQNVVRGSIGNYRVENYFLGSFPLIGSVGAGLGYLIGTAIENTGSSEVTYHAP